MRRTVTIRLAAAMIVAGAVVGSAALAHEGHGETHHDLQMQKLHAMMPMFAAQSAALKTALEKKDAAAVDAAAGKIAAAIPDLKKSKPHKNAAKRKQFAQLAGQLGKEANALAQQAKGGDFASAQTSYSRLAKTCDDCHAGYRD